MICTKIDDYIEDRDCAIYIVELSNETIVYEDENRYGPDDKAWLRLKQYCKENNLNISKVWIQFRSHKELVVENTGDGIFFRRKILGNPFDNNRHYYVFGLVNANKIHTWHWKVPEVIMEEEDDRDIDGCEEQIIWNK